jgi:hypothetical protein
MTFLLLITYCENSVSYTLTYHSRFISEGVDISDISPRQPFCPYDLDMSNADMTGGKLIAA